MPRKRRTPTEIEEVRVAIEHLMAEHGPMTVRQVHYALVSRPELDFENTSFEYQNLERYPDTAATRWANWVRRRRGRSAIPTDVGLERGT